MLPRRRVRAPGTEIARESNFFLASVTTRLTTIAIVFASSNFGIRTSGTENRSLRRSVDLRATSRAYAMFHSSVINRRRAFPVIKDACSDALASSSSAVDGRCVSASSSARCIDTRNDRRAWNRAQDFTSDAIHEIFRKTRAR